MSRNPDRKGCNSSDIRQKRGERGAVSVEFALVLPILITIILGGLHFGQVLTTRHSVADATSYATRNAAINGVADNTVIRSVIENQLGTNSGCSAISVSTNLVTDGFAQVRLDVTTRCTLAPTFGIGFLGAIGPDEITVSAAMPFQ